MTEHEQRRLVDHRLTGLRHAEEVTGNVAQTCRYYGMSRHTFYVLSTPVEYCAVLAG